MAARERMIVRELVLLTLPFKKVSVTVNTLAASGSSAADALLVGGTIIGIVPNGNQDQFVDNVTIATDGAVTVTLAANATANNTFDVTVWRDSQSYL